jgi:hypothetical protein
MKYYTASKSRCQGRRFYSIIFRHPMRKDSTKKSGLRIRKGLGTSDPEKADKLVGQMNQILSDSDFWNIGARSIAEKLYDDIIVSAFYDTLYKKTDKFIVVYESGLGKGWDVVDAIDAKDALKKFEEMEPDIYKLCKYPFGQIRVGREEV